MLIDMDRVRGIIQDSPDLNADDLAGLLDMANADPEEGPDWLPYYKLAVGLDSHALGCLDGAVLAAIKAMEGDPTKAKIVRAITNLRDAAQRLMRLSSRSCGIGPDRTPERAAQVDRLSAELYGDPLPAGQPRDSNGGGEQ